jgi:hypothetical protein
MIHHFSIPARDPGHVAAVLAELLGGRANPFPGPLPGAWMAMSGDAHGTLVEVYPEGAVIAPGEGEGPGALVDGGTLGVPPARVVGFHALLSVPCERAEVERIGAREGWRTKLLGRGAPGQEPAFHVIELWIENRLLLELATPSMVGAYLEATRPVAAPGTEVR